MSGAIGTGEGIGDIAGDGDATPFHGGATPTLDHENRGQIAPAQRLGGLGVSAALQEYGQPARLRASNSPVHSGAASDAQQDVMDAQFGGGHEQFPDAEGRGGHRVALGILEKRQARRRRHFDDGGLSVVDQTDRRIDLHLRKWSGDAPYLDSSMSGGHHRRDGALAAVGHRAAINLDGRIDIPHTFGDGIGDLDGGQTSLELVGGDDDFHDAPAVGMWRLAATGNQGCPRRCGCPAPR